MANIEPYDADNFEDDYDNEDQYDMSDDIKDTNDAWDQDGNLRDESMWH